MHCKLRRVATGDAALGVPEDAPYDRAIMTIGSLDIPPASGSASCGRRGPPSRCAGAVQSVALGVLGTPADSILSCLLTSWA